MPLQQVKDRSGNPRHVPPVAFAGFPFSGTPNHHQREGATSGFPRCARSPPAPVGGASHQRTASASRHRRFARCSDALPKETPAGSSARALEWRTAAPKNRTAEQARTIAKLERRNRRRQSLQGRAARRPCPPVGGMGAEGVGNCVNSGPGAQPAPSLAPRALRARRISIRAAAANPGGTMPHHPIT